MKAKLFDSSGKEKSSVELPERFNSKIREDIIQKCMEVEKSHAMVLHSPNERSGRRHSASGTISHKRHEWKGHYGKGIARVPRKTMWRRGTQFYWVGAEISSARGGRAVHAPSGIRTPQKVNRKEMLLAYESAFASTAVKDLIQKRYATITKVDSAPFVIESLPSKTRDVLETLRNIFGETYNLVLKHKVQRAGVGKARGRRYKSNAGLLIIKGNSEKGDFKGLDVMSLNEVSLQDLFPLGRLTLYTKTALAEMEAKK